MKLFLLNATLHHMVTILEPQGRLRRYYNPISIILCFRDCFIFVKRCDRCQRVGYISRRNEIPLTNMLEVEIFDVWGIPSFGNLYILLAIGYVSKWVEAIATPKNEVKTMVRFVHKNIFTCLVPKGNH